MVQSLPQSDGFRILFNSPELSEVQRSGFHVFLKQGIAEELSKLSRIQVITTNLLVEILVDAQDFRLVAPENNYRDCVLKMKSYTCKLYAQAKILFKEKTSGDLLYETQPEWVLLADLPMMTKRGHFVINGSPRIVVHQVGRAPGIYFKKIVKIKKEMNAQTRFYGDIIPRKGVWVRLQINKKGEVDLKLKKSKKVRAEMVQKCLELLERSEWTREQDLKAVQPRTLLRHRSMPRTFVIGLPRVAVSNNVCRGSSNKNVVFVRCHEEKGNELLSHEAKQNVQKLRFCCQGKACEQALLLSGALFRQRNPVVAELGFAQASSFRQRNYVLTSFDDSGAAEKVFTQEKQRDNTNQANSCESFVTSSKSRAVLAKRSLGKLSSTFTKSEKEAFANVYNSFYKNEIQDLEERVSLSISGTSSRSNVPVAQRTLSSRREKKVRSVTPESKARNEVTALPLFSDAGLSTELGKPYKKEKASKKKTGTKKATTSSNLDKICEYLYQLFKESDLYDLGPVGRQKINKKFGISVTETQLTALDIKEGINWLSKLRAGREEIDDIDHSQNRRVRTSSELIQTQLSIGITRLKNLVTKKIRSGKSELINTTISKPARGYTKAIPTQDAKKALLKQGFVKGYTDSQRTLLRHLHVLFFNRLSEPLLKLNLKKDWLRKKYKFKCFFGVPSTTFYLALVFTKSSFGLQTVKPQTKTVFELESSKGQLERTKSTLPVVAKPSFAQGTLLWQRSFALLIKFIHTSLSKPEYRSIDQANFNRLYFQAGSNCFVRHNKIIDYATLHLKNRITFTSINPFFATSKEKKTHCVESKRNKTKFCYTYKKSMLSCCAEEAQQSVQKRSCCSRTLPKQSVVRSGSPVLVEQALLLTVPSLRRNTVVPKSSFAQTTSENNSLSNLSVSEWFSTKPINGALREFFSSSPLSQYMDQTNPLAEITHKRRISSLGIGGVSRESAGMTIRGIHPTHYGRICPIETPEGKNAGLVNSLAFYAKINDQGFIETPYYRVLKGQIQHELGFSFYSAGQESTGLYIAPNDSKQSKSKLLASNTSTVDSVPVRVSDNLLDLFKKVSPYQVDCIGISPVQILSVATSLIPFLEHNDANRALMGSNMQRQAVSLMISERPLVGTGLEARVLTESGHLVQSKVSGFVSNVSAHRVVVQRLLDNHSIFSAVTKPGPNKAVSKRSCSRFEFDNVFPTLRFFKGITPRPLTKLKERLIQAKLYRCLHDRNAEQSLNTGCVNKTNSFCCRSSTEQGQAKSTLLYVQSSRKARNVVVTKQSFVQANVQHRVNSWCTGNRGKPTTTDQALLEQDGTLINTKLCSVTPVLSPVAHSITTFSRSNQETCQIQKPLVKEGDWVQEGDMLSDCSAGEKGELSVGKNVLIAYIPWQGYNFEDAIVISDRLVKEQLYTSLHIERYTVVVNDFKDKVVDTNEWLTGNLPGVDSRKKAHLQKSGLPRVGTILREGDILVGKIKYSKKKPVTPHEKLVCDILGEHNFSVQNTSLYVPFGVHEARVLSYKIRTRFGRAEALKNNLRPAGSPKVVHLFLGEKRDIQVGDKMSGRHGNKGIVSTILPQQDMPYLADGSPVDILLNPLGVPSRMNVGQVFECLLGLASTYLHQNFKVTAFDEVYGVEASQSLVFLKLYQARLQSGQNWLFQVNFPGKTRLTDGRSGECLDQWITVGRAYMLKLIHMVNEKIHARAIGPYALVTQQPLKGRAHKGGQRLGEMEVWAVEGFGAAYILQELLTKKSDDSVGRKEVLKAMLPKSASLLDFLDPFESDSGSHSEKRAHSEAFTVLGQPDIFKVLICELQALCLDVGVYSIKTESFQREFVGVFAGTELP